MNECPYCYGEDFDELDGVVVLCLNCGEELDRDEVAL